MIRVELIRAWPQRAETRALDLVEPAIIGDALDAAGWMLDAEFVGLAVFGLAATTATLLQDGDRIELLRGLQLDPKQARRLRAERTRSISERKD